MEYETPQTPLGSDWRYPSPGAYEHEHTFDTIEAPWAEIHAALQEDVHPAEEMAGEVPVLAERLLEDNAPGAAGPAIWQVLVEDDLFGETLGDA